MLNVPEGAWVTCGCSQLKAYITSIQQSIQKTGFWHVANEEPRAKMKQDWVEEVGEKKMAAVFFIQL